LLNVQNDIEGISFLANINPASCFGHLNFEDFKIVCGLRLENSTNFDIRISDLNVVD